MGDTSGRRRGPNRRFLGRNMETTGRASEAGAPGAPGGNSNRWGLFTSVSWVLSRAPNAPKFGVQNQMFRGSKSCVRTPPHGGTPREPWTALPQKGSRSDSSGIEFEAAQSTVELRPAHSPSEMRRPAISVKGCSRPIHRSISIALPADVR